MTHSADILVAAMGSPHFVKAPMVKKGAVGDSMSALTATAAKSLAMSILTK
jgi:5,10-methylene-tetrahydrofolate dehydrogenase/methenyl tetrahydrofolate cyclohydrolase